MSSQPPTGTRRESDGWILRWVRYPLLMWILDLLPPITPVMKEIVVVPGIEHRLQEQACDLHAAHVAEAAVGGVNASAHHAEAVITDLFAEQIIFRVESA